MKGVLFLTESGEEIGFGHLSRCQALQEFFADKGLKTLLLLRHKGKDNSYVYKKAKILDWLKDAIAVKKNHVLFDTVLIDSYLAPQNYYRFLKRHFGKVIAIDDYNRLIYPVDAIINPNIYSSSLDYKNQKARILCGKDYLILRPAFISRRKKFCVRNKVKNIAVTLGGSDYRNLLPVIAKGISKPGYNIAILAGTAEYRKKLQDVLKGNRMSIYGNLNAAKMSSLLLKMDIVISATGQTLNELAYLGIPIISICIDKDQVLNQQAYFKNGFLLERLFWDNPDLLGRIRELLQRMEDKRIRQRLAQIGKSIVCGKGKENIYKVLSKN